AEVARFGTTFRVGDKVMQLRNNYQREVFNGDVGRVTAIHEIDHEMRVEFEGREVSYDFSELDELSLAYACTIHKAQGSEFPAVVIPWHTSHYLMLRRNLLYTAITRGRRLVVVVGNRRALSLAISRGEDVLRHSRLAPRIIDESEKVGTSQSTIKFGNSGFDSTES
ncbi:MAG: ATP-dependent RecD-like DNA helicase, partial [Gemmataceae bacterium]|nr:ATP-dependent RecD-like DNA helicase [Gemmataceae bacterium]